jgi:hypothetical protein
MSKGMFKLHKISLVKAPYPTIPIFLFIIFILYYIYMSNKIGIFAPSYNEKNIIEWIDYHLKCGFDKIIIYDDQSDEPIKNIVNKYFVNNTKIIILENIVGKYLVGTFKDGSIAPCSTVRSDFFFNELKKYMCDLNYLLSIDIDEYLYMGKFSDIHELVNYYEPFDNLYFYWNEFFTNIKNNTTNKLIDVFTESSGARYCGKSLGNLNSNITQLSPHVFNSKNINNIFYPDEKYNFINKDVYEIYHDTFYNAGISQKNLKLFLEADKQNKPYIAHYRNQDLKTWLVRRWIERPLLIKNTKDSNIDHLCKIMGYGPEFAKVLKNGSYFGFNIEKIDEYVDYIYNKKYETIELNLHEDLSMAYETIDDLSKIWWKMTKEKKTKNNDLLNFYYKI